VAAKDLPRIPRISGTISVGTLYLASLNARLEGAVPKLFYSVTRKSSDGTVSLKLVNASSTPRPVRIQLDGARVVGDGKLTSQQFGTPFPTVLLNNLVTGRCEKIDLQTWSNFGLGKNRARLRFKRPLGLRHTFRFTRNFSQIDFFTPSRRNVSAIVCNCRSTFRLSLGLVLTLRALFLALWVGLQTYLRTES
jgi:hypothetical protein